MNLKVGCMWIVLLIILVAIIFVISKSGPVKKKESSNVIRKNIALNLKEYPNEYVFSVCGVHLHNYIYPVINICKKLDLITLIPEPDNSFDSDAIKVENSGWHIGYVPASETREIHSIIKKEHIAYIESLNKMGHITVHVKVRFKN